MLVLTRKVDEAIIIGEDGIVVRILGIEHGQVKVGIEAPTEVQILRQELLERTNFVQKVRVEGDPDKAIRSLDSRRWV